MDDARGVAAFPRHSTATLSPADGGALMSAPVCTQVVPANRCLRSNFDADLC